jgi:hypothetical protein
MGTPHPWGVGCGGVTFFRGLAPLQMKLNLCLLVNKHPNLGSALTRLPGDEPVATADVKRKNGH